MPDTVLGRAAGWHVRRSYDYPEASVIPDSMMRLGLRLELSARQLSG